MSLGRQATKYAAAAAVVAIAIIAASTLYMGIPTPQSSTSGQAGESVLAIRLTDPPQVPSGTSSLNVTYSLLNLLVGEPSGTPGQTTTTSIPVTGTKTVDLLSLQNVSRTIALVTVPPGSVIYSLTFTVSSIQIDVGGKTSAVTLATGGTTFTATIAQPRAFQAGDFALFQLNPVVVNTPSGYQLVPSAVGIMGHGNGPVGNDHVGSEQTLTNEDQDELHQAKGSVTADLVALSVSGQTTTVAVRVTNTGSTPVFLNAIGLQGNFTVNGNPCSTTTTATSTEGQGQDSFPSGFGHRCELPDHANQVVFVPAAPSTTATTTTASSSSTTTASTTSASCSSGTMGLVSHDEEHMGLQLSPGQCVELTFSGGLTIGGSQLVLTPSTLKGQAFFVHVIASGGAEERLSCTLPLGANSCSVISPGQDQGD